MLVWIYSFLYEGEQDGRLFFSAVRYKPYNLASLVWLAYQLALLSSLVYMENTEASLGWSLIDLNSSKVKLGLTCCMHHVKC